MTFPDVRTRIHAIGTAVPEAVLTQVEAATIAAELMNVPAQRERAIRALYARSGVEQRHVIFREPEGQDLYNDPSLSADGPTTAARLDVFNQAAIDMAERACRNAMERAGLSAQNVGGVVTVSCTGLHAPGVDIGLIDRLGLLPSVSRTNIGFMGCHGAINGLRVGDAFARATPGKAIIVCCIELCSLHFQHRPTGGAATANALFGDGSAAVVLIADNSPRPALDSFSSTIIPDTTGDMGWRVGDHGFEMTLSPSVPGILRERVGPWIKAWLCEHGLSMADVRRWVIHPGGPAIVDAVADAVNADDASRDLARQTLARHGNMSSPTVLFMLRDMLDDGDDVGTALPSAVLAFGPGLVGEGVLIGK